MAIKVNSQGVSIHIPSALDTAIATAFIARKTDWILHQLQKQPMPQAPREWTGNEVLFFLGEPYFFSLQQADNTAYITQTSTKITLSGRLNRLSASSRRKTVIDWYKTQATHYLNARTQTLSQHLALIPSNITIKTYKARWGSCNTKGEIQYNWKIIQAPKDIIDYLIIHELCHLKHHNHSSAFWHCVEAALPDFKKPQEWLKKQGYKLEI
jgi:predicted metal-dependent hydrolase